MAAGQKPTGRVGLGGVFAAMIVLVTLVACSPSGVNPVAVGTPLLKTDRPSGSQPTSPATTMPPVPAKTAVSHSANGPGAALVALAGLAVKGRAPKTGYSRDQFGQSWRDLDRNGCDQRNDVLRRDLRKFTLKTGTHGCLVLTGTLTSAYTGTVIGFVRGQRTSQEVQIDHVVALSDAWQKGAQRWSAAKRELFANDFLELRAVDGHSNGSKSDSDAASWLPPYKNYWCGFVASQIAVKKKYGLWVTRAEHDTMARILKTCPGQGLPRSYPIKLGGGPEKSAAPSGQSGESAAKLAAPAGGAATSYRNCDAVRAAGRAPIRAGQPGYSRKLDRDGDGVGCE